MHKQANHLSHIPSAAVPRKWLHKVCVCRFWVAKCSLCSFHPDTAQPKQHQQQVSSGAMGGQVVAGAGGVDHDQLVSLSEKAFSGLSTDPTTAYDLVQKASLRRLVLELGRKTLFSRKPGFSRFTASEHGDGSNGNLRGSGSTACLVVTTVPACDTLILSARHSTACLHAR